MRTSNARPYAHPNVGEAFRLPRAGKPRPYEINSFYMRDVINAVPYEQNINLKGV